MKIIASFLYWSAWSPLFSILSPQVVHLMCSILLLHESNSPQPDTSSFLPKLKEPTQPKNLSQHSTHPQSVSADTVPFMTQK